MIQAQLTLRSVSLEMDTKVNVLLPEDRHQTIDTRGKKYPVLYILHGMKEDCSSWLNLSNIMLMCRDLDLIVVFPSANNSSYLDTAYGFGYYNWISQELPTKLKNYFPITDDPAQTFIMGESMGGYGTMRIAFANPDRYGKAVVLSAGNIAERLKEGNPLSSAFSKDIEAELASDNNIENLVYKLQKYEGTKPAYRFYCGTEDRVYESCHRMAQFMKEQLPDYDIQDEYWPGQHNFFFWNEAIPKALEFFGFEIKQNSVI
ncbi:MAG: hypothetical protein IJI05_05015 [Erysipelotrichaceae bacterium]|nr:hypothetical protein [Erysipelotrichaceae bacterium]